MVASGHAQAQPMTYQQMAARYATMASRKVVWVPVSQVAPEIGASKFPSTSAVCPEPVPIVEADPPAELKNPNGLTVAEKHALFERFQQWLSEPVRLTRREIFVGLGAPGNPK